jgi:hypothetical protein
MYWNVRNFCGIQNSQAYTIALGKILIRVCGIVSMLVPSNAIRRPIIEAVKIGENKNWSITIWARTLEVILWRLE